MLCCLMSSTSCRKSLWLVQIYNLQIPDKSGRKTGEPRKNAWSKDKNQQQKSHLTYDAVSVNSCGNFWKGTLL